jgi:hypothetical protein
MIIEADLRTGLLAVPEITNIVGRQIYGIMRPRGERPLPEVLIFKTRAERQVKFCGTDKLVNADFQIDSYGMEGLQVLTLARAIRQALVDFVGMMGDSQIEKIFLSNEFPMIDPDPLVIRVVQIYNIWYMED